MSCATFMHRRPRRLGCVRCVPSGRGVRREPEEDRAASTSSTARPRAGIRVDLRRHRLQGVSLIDFGIFAVLQPWCPSNRSPDHQALRSPVTACHAAAQRHHPGTSSRWRVDVGGERPCLEELLQGAAGRAADDRVPCAAISKARRAEVGDFHHASVGDGTLDGREIAVAGATARRLAYARDHDAFADPPAEGASRARATSGVTSRCDDPLGRFSRDFLGFHHHDEEDVLLLLGGQDRDDVRVVEAREQPQLLQELPRSRRAHRLCGSPEATFLSIHVSSAKYGAEAAAADRRRDFCFSR